jgi:peptide-methionine (S)-S-oxide reductase
MSAVLTSSEEQREAAFHLKEDLSRQRGELHTEIAPLGVFTLAEDYHQKYALRHQRDLMREFTAIYPTLAALLGSTAVTRANGFASGYGTSALLEAEIELYGLSPDGQHTLRELVRRYQR